VQVIACVENMPCDTIAKQWSYDDNTLHAADEQAQNRELTAIVNWGHKNIKFIFTYNCVKIQQILIQVFF